MEKIRFSWFNEVLIFGEFSEMENSNRIAYMYHPTTVAVIDDDKEFLTTIAKELHLVDKHIVCKLYNDPIEAFQTLEQLKTPNHFLKNIITTDISSEDYFPTSKKLPIQINISEIYHQAYDNHCFNTISVAVIDFKMPKMDGAELCRKLSGNPVKKIMLTGEDDTSFALNLFNQGIIDKFILKDDPHLPDLLAQNIIEMQKRYFQDLTSPVIKGLAMDHESCLGDPAFIKFFNQVCVDISASSYYLIEPSGSYLLIDDSGSPTWLIIKAPEELKDFVELMEDANFAPEVISAVSEGNQIPYFANSHDYIHSTDSDVTKYLHPAKKLKGEKVYRYFLTNTLPDFTLDKNRIASFDRYAEKG